MHTGSLPWRDANQEEITSRVIQGDRLAFEPNAHAWLAPLENLALACMSYNAEDRPRSLAIICAALLDIQRGLPADNRIEVLRFTG